MGELVRPPLPAADALRVGDRRGLYKNQGRRVLSPTLFVARLDDGRSVVVEGTEGLAYTPDKRIVMQVADEYWAVIRGRRRRT